MTTLETFQSSGDEQDLWNLLDLQASHLSSPNSKAPEINLDHVDINSQSSLQHPSLWQEAVRNSIQAHTQQVSSLPTLTDFHQTHIEELEQAEKKLLELADRLQEAEQTVLNLQSRAQQCSNTATAADIVQKHLSAFIDEVVIEPRLVRHIVDGKVGDSDYNICLAQLSKKSALYEMEDIKQAAAFNELNDHLQNLIATAVAKVRTFLVDKIALLKRPNTNVNIVKENVLLQHRALVEFVEMHTPDIFREVKSSYVETMSRTYYVLFRRYTAGLLNMKQLLPSELADTLVGSLTEDGKGGISNLFSSSASKANGVAGRSGAGVGQFALKDRLEVLKDVEGPAIVLATAVDTQQRFYYEQIHRSLGKMLSETCASEHIFCKEFFGEANGRMFNSFFRRIIGFLLEAVEAHTVPTRDTIGVLLALKVNEGQRSSMQKRNILDLSDFFIKVDILLKPKFKKLFEENITSMTQATVAISKSAGKGSGDTSPHIITRRFAEFSASILAISRFGTPDDSILEGLRRLRSEYNGFLNAMSALFVRPKLRYIFLINNIELILSMFRLHKVSSMDDNRVFAELQEVHTAAYVEHEVADHFPDIVSFVRQYERTLKVSMSSQAGGRPFPSDERVKAILRQFASNWQLGVQHMQDNVLREFPNFDLGVELTRSLFARVVAYHKRSEAAIQKQYPRLRADLVTSTELIYDLRQRTTRLTN